MYKCVCAPVTSGPLLSVTCLWEINLQCWACDKHPLKTSALGGCPGPKRLFNTTVASLVNRNADSLPSISACQDTSCLQSINWNLAPFFFSGGNFCTFSRSVWFKQFLQKFLLMIMPALCFYHIKDLSGKLMYTKDDTHASVSGISIMSHLNYSFTLDRDKCTVKFTNWD